MVFPILRTCYLRYYPISLGIPPHIVDPGLGGEYASSENGSGQPIGVATVNNDVQDQLSWSIRPLLLAGEQQVENGGLFYHILSGRLQIPENQDGFRNNSPVTPGLQIDLSTDANPVTSYNVEQINDTVTGDAIVTIHPEGGAQGEEWDYVGVSNGTLNIQRVRIMPGVEVPAWIVRTSFP
ncbi:hypothetical protein RhiJN_08518 [Ceratobasidium sp. AG-Ba]|nr:hypothetical protein RhiJN_08518 [Ceratobasidium sp. AG-Ba]